MAATGSHHPPTPPNSCPIPPSSGPEIRRSAGRGAVARLFDRLRPRRRVDLEAVDAAACAAEAALAHLIGPVHGTLQTIRGMCTDSQAHEAIDAKLAELDELVYEAAALLHFGPRDHG